MGGVLTRPAAELIVADHVARHLYDAARVVDAWAMPRRGCYAVLVRAQTPAERT